MTANNALLCVAAVLALALLTSTWDLKLRPKVQQAAGAAHPLFPPVKQEKQSLRETLSWRPPHPPAVEDPHFPPQFELKSPEAPNSVRVICMENSIRVEAKRDLLGIGQLIKPADITLGVCPSTGEDTQDQVLIFESELHECGSQLLIYEDTFDYVFKLQYTPSPLGNTPIIRTRNITVSIQCQYQRKHNVTSSFLNPTWTPFSDAKVSEESLYFSFKLMTDDWQFARPSSEFLLGDMMKFEVSIKQFHHTPLRVMVDDCVATVVRNTDTVPRYSFMGNNGCLFDSQVTGSSSRFLPRSQEDHLRFEVEAFKFQQDYRGVIYITCNLKATAVTAVVDSGNKACSFANGWTEASGVHEACSCCDRDCGTGSWPRVTGNRGHLTSTGAEWKEEVAVGPVTVKERPLSDTS
ncbi:zona pellucida sperm-binding protein 3-like [Corythoichthys intestinalis]|uniref:zona pellucida sperm-binding protein 3-like n=1 Tax=Corythoichthys intestinalis TaxID=161448 RepID=UPI0025A68D49|nr:zona pellucida sperm-binding protein 3-like [Corythoichthys intestinalis]XP_061812967.1 zona pellucida sperm-binding protein 3-like [Nerophis lumbriciformis]